eukprot:1161304-Pelagomonas_calceolata.AAC.9
MGIRRVTSTTLCLLLLKGVKRSLLKSAWCLQVCKHSRQNDHEVKSKLGGFRSVNTTALRGSKV